VHTRVVRHTCFCPRGTSAKHRNPDRCNPNNECHASLPSSFLWYASHGGARAMSSITWIACIVWAWSTVSLSSGASLKLSVGCHDTIHTPTGDVVKHKRSMVYLGGLSSDDGRAEEDLAGRIGTAKSDFDTLCHVWGHASIPRRDKLRILDACVMNKLMYAMHTSWLNASSRGRLDGFQAKCLRRVLGISPSFLSQ